MTRDVCAFQKEVRPIVVARSLGGSIGNAQRYHMYYQPLLREEFLSSHALLDVWKAPPLSTTAFIVTSRLGVDSLMRADAHLKHPNDRRQRALICVGEATATYARNMGFTPVLVGDGHAKSILKQHKILQNYHTFYHISGHDIAHDLIHDLKKEYPKAHAQRIITYQTHTPEQLRPTVQRALQNQRIHTIFLFSHKAALCLKNLAPMLPPDVKILGLSPRITNVFPMHSSFVCPTPKAMLELLNDPSYDTHHMRGLL